MWLEVCGLIIQNYSGLRGLGEEAGAGEFLKTPPKAWLVVYSVTSVSTKSRGARRRKSQESVFGLERL